jgi:signal transduction histidine kinase
MLAARTVALPQRLVARVAALPPPRRQRVQDVVLALVLAVVNAVSLVPYRGQLHPFWGAELLVVAQAILLIWRRRFPVTTALLVGATRVSYDQIGFGFAPFVLAPAIALFTVFDQSCLLWRWVVSTGTAAGVAVSLSAPGHNAPYEAITQALIFLTAAAAGLLSRANRANLQAAEGRADRAEAELDRRAAEQAAAERTRIARELHDVVAHHVSLMAVQAEAAMSLLPDKPVQARSSVEIIGDTARLALTELRRLLGVLRGPSERLETAPSASLGELGVVLDQVRGAGLAVDFKVEGAPVPLPPGIDLTAYRIVQEALTNTIRHSRAASAAVTLRYEPGYVTVCIADQGRRRNLPLPAASNGHGPAIAGSGFGLAGITERVASCGGSLTVGPTPGGGFSVAARLPSR